MQNLQLAHHEYQQSLCSCGRPMSECGDPDKPWYPQRAVCYAQMEAASANFRYDQLHKDMPYHDGSFNNWSKEQTAQSPCHYRDGVTIWVAAVDLDPDDQFLTRQSDQGEAVDDDGHTA